MENTEKKKVKATVTHQQDLSFDLEHVMDTVTSTLIKEVVENQEILIGALLNTHGVPYYVGMSREEASMLFETHQVQIRQDIAEDRERLYVGAKEIGSWLRTPIIEKKDGEEFVTSMDFRVHWGSTL